MSCGEVPCPHCGNYYCGMSDSGPVARCFERYEMSMRDRSGGSLKKLPDPFEHDSSGVTLGSLAAKDDLLKYLTDYLHDEVFAQRFTDCIALIRAKNADYTQGTARRDRIAAFRRIAGDIGVPMEKVWAIFCQKHWGAVMRYVKDGEVESEPIDGRINDIINYMVLLGAIIGDDR